MKNVLLILVSVVVGYGFAYLSASKKWAPFGKMKGQETNYSKTLVPGESNPDSGDYTPVLVTQAEMKTLSDNYAAWITELSGKAAKGSVQKGASAQIVIRGGKISADLLDRLAKGNKDVYYIFGKKANRSPIYMLLSNFESESSTSVNGQLDYYLASDSATMCPCICPESLIALPNYCNPDPLPPLPIEGSSNPQP